MRWVVGIGKGGPLVLKETLYLPRANDEESFRVRLPVAIWRAATFRTKRAAQEAVDAARARGFPIETVEFEKTYARSFRPEETS